MGKGLLAGGAGDSAAAAGAGVRAPLTARDLRDLRAVLRAVRDEGGVTLVRLRHFELELQPQHARDAVMSHHVLTQRIHSYLRAMVHMDAALFHPTLYGGAQRKKDYEVPKVPPQK